MRAVPTGCNPVRSGWQARPLTPVVPPAGWLTESRQVQPKNPPGHPSRRSTLREPDPRHILHRIKRALEHFSAHRQDRHPLGGEEGVRPTMIGGRRQTSRCVFAILALQGDHARKPMFGSGPGSFCHSRLPHSVDQPNAKEAASRHPWQTKAVTGQMTRWKPGLPQPGFGGVDEERIPEATSGAFSHKTAGFNANSAKWDAPVGESEGSISRKSWKGIQPRRPRGGCRDCFDAARSPTTPEARRSA